MQSISNVNFQVEVKFDSVPAFFSQMQMERKDPEKGAAMLRQSLGDFRRELQEVFA
jgi:phage shock protein A